MAREFLQASLAFAAAWVVALAFDAASGVSDISDLLAHNSVNTMHWKLRSGVRVQDQGPCICWSCCICRNCCSCVRCSWKVGKLGPIRQTTKLSQHISAELSTLKFGARLQPFINLLACKSREKGPRRAALLRVWYLRWFMFERTSGAYPKSLQHPKWKESFHKQSLSGKGYAQGVCWNFLRWHASSDPTKRWQQAQLVPLQGKRLLFWSQALLEHGCPNLPSSEWAVTKKTLNLLKTRQTIFKLFVGLRFTCIVYVYVLI